MIWYFFPVFVKGLDKDEFWYILDCLINVYDSTSLWVIRRQMQPFWQFPINRFPIKSTLKIYVYILLAERPFGIENIGATTMADCTISLEDYAAHFEVWWFVRLNICGVHDRESCGQVQHPLLNLIFVRIFVLNCFVYRFIFLIYWLRVVYHLKSWISHIASKLKIITAFDWDGAGLLGLSINLNVMCKKCLEIHF